MSLHTSLERSYPSLHVKVHTPFAHVFVAFSTLHCVPCLPQSVILSASHALLYIRYPETQDVIEHDPSWQMPAEAWFAVLQLTHCMPQWSF